MFISYHGMQSNNNSVLEEILKFIEICEALWQNQAELGRVP